MLQEAPSPQTLKRCMNCQQWAVMTATDLQTYAALRQELQLGPAPSMCPSGRIWQHKLPALPLHLTAPTCNPKPLSRGFRYHPRISNADGTMQITAIDDPQHTNDTMHITHACPNHSKPSTHTPGKWGMGPSAQPVRLRLCLCPCPHLHCARLQGRRRCCSPVQKHTAHTQQPKWVTGLIMRHLQPQTCSTC